MDNQKSKCAKCLKEMDEGNTKPATNVENI